MAEERDAYKEAKRVFSTGIRMSKNESCKKLIDSINHDPWGLPYKIVMGKLRKAHSSNVPEDEASLRRIVEVLFTTGEPRDNLPNAE